MKDTAIGCAMEEVAVLMDNVTAMTDGELPTVVEKYMYVIFVSKSKSCRLITVLIVQKVILLKCHAMEMHVCVTRITEHAWYYFIERVL